MVNSTPLCIDPFFILIKKLGKYWYTSNPVFGQFVIKFRKSSNLKLLNTSGILVPCTEPVSCICQF